MTDTDQKKEDKVLRRMLATKPQPHKTRSEIQKLDRPVNEREFEEATPPKKKSRREQEVDIDALRKSLARPDFQALEINIGATKPKS